MFKQRSLNEVLVKLFFQAFQGLHKNDLQLKLRESLLCFMVKNIKLLYLKTSLLKLIFKDFLKLNSIEIL